MLLDAIGGLFSNQRAGLGGLTQIWPRENAYKTWTGKDVTEEAAMGLSALFACVSRLSGSIAALPLYVYHRKDNGEREQFTKHPTFRMLVVRPNRNQTPYEYKRFLAVNCLLGGNHYGDILRNDRREPVEILPLLPSNVRVRPNSETGKLDYFYQDGYVEKPIKNDVAHVRGLSMDGCLGVSPVSLARQAIALGLSIEEYQAKFLANDATPRGLLKNKQLVEDDNKARIRREWESMHKGVNNAHRIGIMDLEFEYEQIGLSMKDAEFVESRKFQSLDVCTWYQMPPHMAGLMDRATFNSTEQMFLEYLQLCLDPWLRCIEEALMAALLRDKERDYVFFEFAREKLISVDNRTLEEGRARRLLSGSSSINEIRRERNQNAIDGGDVHLIPSSHVPLELFGQTEPSGSGKVGSDVSGTQDESNARGERRTRPRERSGGSGEQDGDFDELFGPRIVEPLVRDAIARVYRREARTIQAKYRQASKRSAGLDEFRQWYWKFRDGEHREFLSEALEPAVETLSAFLQADSSKMLEQIVERSIAVSDLKIDDILDPTKRAFATFEAAFKSFDTWEEERTEELVEEMFKYTEEDNA